MHYKTLDELKEALMCVYQKDTAHKDWQDKWKKENPSIGQCVPTALIVRHYFGGDIYRHNVRRHWYNCIDGKFVDLTKEQFDYELDYSNGIKKEPEMERSQVKERFKLLKERLEKFAEEKEND